MAERGQAGQGASRSPGTEPKLIQSVERALTMLEVVAASDTPLSATEVASQAGVNRGTAWRLLATLEHFDLVEHDRITGRYAVGYGAARLAAASGTPALVRRSRPVLEALSEEVGESVYLQVTSGYAMTVLDEVRSRRPVQVHIDMARLEVPLHCNSAGKLFLAFLPADEREEFLAQPLQEFTQRTVTDPDQLRAELARARADRFAVAHQEHLPDWGGISAAVCDPRGQPSAYVNVTVPAYRYTEDGLKAFAQPLLRAAADLEERLLPVIHSRRGIQAGD